MENKVPLDTSNDPKSFVTPQADPTSNCKADPAYQNTNAMSIDPRTNPCYDGPQYPNQHHPSNMTSNFAVDQQLNTNDWDNLNCIQVGFCFGLFCIIFK